MSLFQTNYPDQITTYLHRLQEKIDTIRHQQQQILKLLTQHPHLQSPEKSSPQNQSLPSLNHPDIYQNSIIHPYQQSQIQINYEQSIYPSEKLNIYFKQDNLYQNDIIEQLNYYQQLKEQSQYLIKPHQQQLDINNIQQVKNNMESLFTQIGLSFNHCQCVYSYPDMATQNFHQKIFDKNNVLILMELTNQQIVGAFTEVSFSSKAVLIPKDNPRCCLFNLTLKHFLYASRTNKTHSCDKNYLLFGNWQIKIKVGQPYLESDLGTRGDCFTKQNFGTPQNTIPNTKEWIFGELAQFKKFELKRYIVYIFK